MSTPFSLTVGGKQYEALPASFAFLKKNKARLQKLETGQMSDQESQEHMVEVIIHCIQRAAPNADPAEIEEALDAVEISRLSMEIGMNTRKQIAAALGVDNLGEAKAGQA